MNPFKLFIPSYLFDPTPGASFMYFIPLLLFFILVFLASWQVKALLHKSKNLRVNMELLGKIPIRMREFAILGALLTFFRNENIPYLAIRFWLVLFFILTLAYAIWLWRHYKKNFSVRIVEKHQEAAVDKYMPQAKKRKKKKRK